MGATKKLTDQEMFKLILDVVEEYEGDCCVLESAVGALIVGRNMGWHALRLMHSGRTFRRYEEILGVKFRDVLPERTKESTRMAGIRMADELGKFWQVVTAGMVSAREAAIMKGT